MTLYELLRQWRKAEAESLQLPVFFVLSNAHLAAVAAARPTTIDELAACPGMGPKKLGYFGQSLLAVVRQAVSEGLETGVSLPEPALPPASVGPLTAEDVATILTAVRQELGARVSKRLKGRYSPAQVSDALRHLSLFEAPAGHNPQPPSLSLVNHG